MIDQKKCVRCGKCVEVCPVGTMKAGADKAPFFDKEAHCIACGHCAAYCPTQAMTLEAGLPANCFDPAPASLTPAQLAGYLRSRRSVRNYLPQPVDHATIEAVLDVVRFAPTGINRQTVRWIIIESPQEVRRLAGLVADWLRSLPDAPQTAHIKGALRVWDSGTDSICRGAPHLALAFTPGASWLDSADVMIALTYFELALPAFGLGGCWAGFLAHATSLYQPLKEALGIKPEYQAFGGLMFGYPRDRIVTIPRRNAAQVEWR